MLQVCRCHIGNLAFFAVDLFVESAHHAIGERRRKRIEQARNERMLCKSLYAHDGRDMISRPKMTIVGEKQQMVGDDRTVGSEGNHDVHVVRKERTVISSRYRADGLRQNESRRTCVASRTNRLRGL